MLNELSSLQRTADDKKARPSVCKRTEPISAAVFPRSAREGKPIAMSGAFFECEGVVSAQSRGLITNIRAPNQRPYVVSYSRKIDSLGAPSDGLPSRTFATTYFKPNNNMRWPYYRRAERRATPATLTGVRGRPTVASAVETKLCIPGMAAALQNQTQQWRQSWPPERCQPS